jgi:hypothetical protein
VQTALNRADGDGIGDQIRLGPRLDREKSGEALQHVQSLSKRQAGG